MRARARIMHGRYGDQAYFLARERARLPDGRRVRFWTRVAIELARLEAREIGLGASDRWREPPGPGAPNDPASAVRTAGNGRRR